MLVDYRHILMQLVIILLLWVLTRLVRRINPSARVRRLCRYIWVLVLWIMSFINLGMYWLAYPMALWMILALGLIFIQLIHNHEFIYRRYWPVFWNWSLLYVGIVFIGSLFSNSLPLV